jgi:hypothetical protein
MPLFMASIKFSAASTKAVLKSRTTVALLRELH